MWPLDVIQMTAETIVSLWQAGLSSDEIATRAALLPLGVLLAVYSEADERWLMAERLMYHGFGVAEIARLAELPEKLVGMIFEDHGILPPDESCVAQGVKVD